LNAAEICRQMVMDGIAAQAASQAIVVVIFGFKVAEIKCKWLFGTSTMKPRNGGNAAQRLVRLRPMGKLAAIPQESVTVEN